MAQASFTPVASSFLSAGPISSNVTIQPGGSILSVTNTGEYEAFINMGTTTTVTATFRSGLVILPKTTEYLTVGSNTQIAAITALCQVGLNVVSGN